MDRGDAASKTSETVNVVRTSLSKIILLVFILHLLGLISIALLIFTPSLDLFPLSQRNFMTITMMIISEVDLIISLYLLIIATRFYSFSRRITLLFATYFSISAVIRVYSPEVILHIYGVNIDSLSVSILISLILLIVAIIIPSTTILASVAFMILNQERYTKKLELILYVMTAIGMIVSITSFFTLMTPTISLILFYILKRYLFQNPVEGKT